VDRPGQAHSLASNPDNPDPRLILEASGAVLRMVQNRPLFSVLLGGSLALHALLFLLLALLEAPAAPPKNTVEIPVELVSEAQAKAAGQESGPATGKGEPAKEQEAKSAGAQEPQPAKPQETKSASAEDAKTAKPDEAKPAAAKPPPQQQAEAPKSPEPVPQPAKPEAKPEPAKPEPAKAAEAKPPVPVPEPKPATAQPSKQALAQAAPPKPPAPEPPAQAAQPPQPKPLAAKPVAPAPTMAALQGPDGGRGGLSPVDMDDPWQAVAVPSTSDSGEIATSYKTLVLGTLELAKRYPEDARNRGAHGTAVVYFEVNDQGEAKNIKLLKSSGDTELDVESLAIVLRAAPFPKPPQGAQRIFAIDIGFGDN